MGKIKEINAAEVINKEEEILEAALGKEEAEEIEELVDIAAAEIAAEEDAEEIAEEIDELTNIAAAEIVAEELAEEIGDELVELEIGSQEVTTEAVESEDLNNTEDSQSTSSEEGSGDVPTIDFGDIMEVVL